MHEVMFNLRHIPMAHLGFCLLLVLAGCGKQGRPTVVAGGDVERGRVAIERHGCVACHIIPGVPNFGSNVGPPLDRIAGRAYIAGVLANKPEEMVRWLRDPPSVDPLTAMPDMGIPEAEAKDIAAYLYTLR